MKVIYKSKAVNLLNIKKIVNLNLLLMMMRTNKLFKIIHLPNISFLTLSTLTFIIYRYDICSTKYE